MESCEALDSTLVAKHMKMSELTEPQTTNPGPRPPSPSSSPQLWTKFSAEARSPSWLDLFLRYRRRFVAQRSPHGVPGPGIVLRGNGPVVRRPCRREERELLVRCSCAVDSMTKAWPVVQTNHALGVLDGQGGSTAVCESGCLKYTGVCLVDGGSVCALEVVSSEPQDRRA